MQDLVITFSRQFSDSYLDPVTSDDPTFDHDVQEHVFSLYIILVNWKQYTQITGYIEVSGFQYCYDQPGISVLSVGGGQFLHGNWHFLGNWWK